MKILYLRGVLGDSRLLEECRGAVKQILTGEHATQDLEKLQGHDVYSFRINRRSRLLFTTMTVEQKCYFLILDFLPTHDYHKSRFLRSTQILASYKEKQHELKAASEKENNEIIFSHFSIAASQERFSLLNLKSEIDATDAEMALDYYRNQMITLNLEQVGALNIAVPAIISGVAGTGKSCVALALLLSQIEKLTTINAADRPRFLYITKSKPLTEAMDKLWREHPASQDCAADVYLMTYDTLLPFVENGQISELKADQEAEPDVFKLFVPWYQDYVSGERNFYKAKKVSYTELNAQTLYHEFRICCGYSEPDYLRLGAHRSLFKVADRERIYKVYNDFVSFLKGSEFKYEFHSVEKRNQFDFIVVDESQDLSYLQLKNLKQLAKNDSIVFCLDSHQRLFDIHSVRPYLLRDLSIPKSNQVELSITYRCPLNVVRAVNEVILLKHQIAGGTADKQEPLQIDALASSASMGHVFMVDYDNTQELTWLREQANKTHVVVVTLEEYREEATRLFATPLVMTPSQIKGLEYPIVIAHRLCLSGQSLKEVKRRLKTLDLTKRPEHLAKEGKGDDRFTKKFNQSIVAYTRAQNILIISEKKSHANSFILDRIQPIATQEVLQDEHLGSISSPETWQMQVLLQYDNENKALARDIFDSKLRCKDFSFEQFITEQRPKPEPVVIPLQPKVTSVVSAASIFSSTSKIQKELVSISTTSYTFISPDLAEKSFAREVNIIKTLFDQFDEQRLKIALRVLDVNALFFSQVVINERTYTLVDILQEQVNKGLCLSNAFLNDVNLLRKILLDEHIGILRILKKLGVNFDIQYNIKIEKDNPIQTAPLTHIAAEKGQVGVLTLFYEWGINLQSDDPACFPVHMAAVAGQTKVLQLFKTLGLDLNKPVGNSKLRAIHYAVMEGQVEALACLEQLGADLANSVLSHGRTLAHLAAGKGHVSVLNFLKTRRFPLDANNSEGQSPLHLAAIAGDIHVLKFLKANNAKIDRKDHNGITPPEYAMSLGHVQAAIILATPICGFLSRAERDQLCLESSELSGEEIDPDILQAMMGSMV